MPRMDWKEPSFLTCFSCRRKSSRVNSPFESFLPHPSGIRHPYFFGLFQSMFPGRPDPEYGRPCGPDGNLPARRPVFGNANHFDGLTGDTLDGKSCTASGIAVHLCQDGPVDAKVSSKALAVVTASWPVMESSTSRISWGCTSALIFRSSAMSFSSMVRRPAVSRMTISRL